MMSSRGCHPHHIIAWSRLNDGPTWRSVIFAGPILLLSAISAVASVSMRGKSASVHGDRPRPGRAHANRFEILDFDVARGEDSEVRPQRWLPTRSNPAIQ